MQQPRPGSSGSGSGRDRVVIFQDHDDGADAYADDISDIQSELDLDLYDTDEVPDVPGGMSLGNIPSILNRDSLVMSPTPQSARASQQPIATHEHRRYHPQPRSDDVASNSSSLNYTLPDTASSAGGSSQRPPFARRPVNPNPMIRTDFTTVTATASSVTAGSTLPYLDDNYEQLSTPPSELAHAHPEQMAHPAYAQAPRTEMSMRSEWLVGLIGVGIGLGVALQSQDPDPQIAYWLTTIGDVYARMTACVTLPLAFCQVVTCTAELVNSGELRRAWLFTMLYFAITVVLSAWLGVLCGGAFQSMYETHAPRPYRLPHAKFAFKCSDGHYLQQQPGGQVTCSGTEVNTNTTFPRLVDVYQRLGLEETVGNVNLSGYIFALVEVYFPQNLVHALTHDTVLSALLVALVLGAAIGKSFTCPKGQLTRSKNPLFRLFTHVYLSLFAMHDWVQKLALWATVPLLMGAVLEIPNATDTLALMRYYMVAVLLASFGQCLVVVPALFYVVTRQNPYRWIARMLSPMSYAMILSSPFLPLAVATKAALRSGQVSPRVFGAVYPVLSALNRSHFALGVPSGLLYVAAFSGCAIELSASNVLLMFGLTCIGSLGDTMLPRGGMAYFFMVWRAFCENEDAPSSVLMIASVGLLVFRLSAFVGTMTNMLLIRMVAHAVEKGDHDRKSLHPLDSIFDGQRADMSHASSPAASAAPVLGVGSMRVL